MFRLDTPERLQAALHDAYVIERELGGGGMSRTYVAREVALDRRVVLKVLPPDLAATVSHERFRREILTIASLQHPNIVGILTTDEVEGLPYFTMPFVEGESLRMRLERQGPLSIAQTVTILRDVARALSYAHERGVVHRDIKPDNVLLSAGAAVVADFGIAKALTSAREDRHEPARSGSITAAGMALGTPAYMAPEQAAGDPNADSRTDLYSFGVMAYEMLTGTTPFTGRSPAQLMAAHIAEPPPAIAAARSDVPRALADLVMACLQKEPGARPGSALEVAQALEDPAMVSGAFASAPSLPATMASVPAPPRVRPATALLAAGLLLALGTFLAPRLRVTSGDVPPSEVPPVASLDARAIAVMPLVSLSADSTDEYLAAGMTDELASALVRVGDFRVVSRSASQLAQQRGATPTEIGRDLGVSYLLEGTVQRQGDRVRVTTRLVSAADGFTVWSDVYDRAGRDLFAVQDELALAVVEAVGEELGVPVGAALADRSASTPATPSPVAVGSAAAPAPAPPVALVARSAVDPVAYDHYLRGLALSQRRDAASLNEALREFGLAVRRDSGFARAWAGIATTQAQLPSVTTLDARTASARGLAAAERAIQLDPQLAAGYAARGMLAMLNWEFDAAERDLARALSLDQDDALALQWMGELRLRRGDASGATAVLRRAEVLDPASPGIATFRALARHSTGSLDSALATARRTTESAPTLVAPRLVYGSLLLDGGQTDEAIRELQAARALSPNAPSVLGALGAAFALNGERVRAEDLLNQLRANPNAPSAATATAKVLVSLGERDSAFVYLYKAADARDPSFASEPLSLHVWDPIRGDPRFAELLRRVGPRTERDGRRPPPPNAPPAGRGRGG